MANYESEAKLEDRMIDQLRRRCYSYIEYVCLIFNHILLL